MDRKRPTQSWEQPQTRNLSSAEKEPEQLELSTSPCLPLSLSQSLGIFHVCLGDLRGEGGLQTLWPEVVSVFLKSRGVGWGGDSNHICPQLLQLGGESLHLQLPTRVYAAFATLFYYTCLFSSLSINTTYPCEAGHGTLYTVSSSPKFTLLRKSQLSLSPFQPHEMNSAAQPGKNCTVLEG